MLASASGARELSDCEIRLWSVSSATDDDNVDNALISTLTHHEYDVQAMSFNGDDTLLISIGM